MTTAWKSFRAQSPPATKTPPDEERAPAAARSLDSPEAFAEIFDRYFSEIHRYVARRLGTGVADDIAAETFLIAYRKRLPSTTWKARSGPGCTASRRARSAATAGTNCVPTAPCDEPGLARGC